MADLKAIAEELGLARPRTYIASGNLLFASDEAEERLRRLLEKRLQAHMGSEVRVMLRTAEEMAAIVSANPVRRCARKSGAAFFLNEPPQPDLMEACATKPTRSAWRLGAREVFVAYGERVSGDRACAFRLPRPGTARNMNTVAKLAELAKEMQ